MQKWSAHSAHCRSEQSNRDMNYKLQAFYSLLVQIESSITFARPVVVAP